MRYCYMYFLGFVIYCRLYQIVAKTSREEILPNDNSKLQCSTGQDVAQLQSDAFDTQSHFKDGEKYAFEPNQFAEKRSVNEIPTSKKQVGVIYKNDNPIGILQPAQRSYRFIPVYEDNFFGFDKLQGGKALAYNAPETREIKKRQIEGIHYDNYPSILTNFKIGNKLDQKRNQEIAAETLNSLKSDDMGLIDEGENHPEKREIADSDTEVDEEEDDEIRKVKNKRNKDCIDEPAEQNEQMHPNSNHATEIVDDNEFKHQTMYPNLVEKRDEMNGANRYKQDVQSQTDNENLEETEELSDFDNSLLNERKLSPNRHARDTENNPNERSADYDKKIEHQIQSKIDALKEEVKREIKLVKEKQNEDDTQRKKRQITNNLIDEETEDINPALDPDTELKTQIRRRRAVADVLENSKHPYFSRIVKPRLRHSYAVRKKRNPSNLENRGKISDLFEGKNKENDLIKRNSFSNSRDSSENTMTNKKAAFSSSDQDRISYLPQRIYNEQAENKRQVGGNTNTKIDNKIKHNHLSPRFRRRINEKGVGANRPQQLSDMSALDIFGALPKSYDAELSRFKRVKRE